MQNQNIVKIVEDITMSIVGFTDMKGINLLFDTDIEEKVIACDVDKIERIILNLISNAIKFTDCGGSIFVNIFEKGDYIEIIVKDTGIGIPNDKQEVIFERFVQVEQTLTRNNEGSGIGLSMAKSFVEMHGGTLTVSSEYGKGSSFIIELPVTILKTEEDIVHFEDVERQQRIERINIEFSDIYCS
jgi:signal transduction histidine kinase